MKCQKWLRVFVELYHALCLLITSLITRVFFLCAFADKVCDAVEVAGRNVMSTTSVVTTGLVSNRYLSQLKYVFNASLHHQRHNNCKYYYQHDLVIVLYWISCNHLWCQFIFL